MRDRPDLHDAVNTVVSEHRKVLADLMPRKKDVACFAGWQILKGHGEDVAEEFFTDLGNEDTVQGPIGLLRAKLMADAENRTDLSKQEGPASLSSLQCLIAAGRCAGCSSAPTNRSHSSTPGGCRSE